MPVITLQEPPKGMLVRNINQAWKEEIKKKLKTQTGPVITVLPCLVDPKAISKPEDFNKNNLPAYIKYTLGGNHLRTAMQELILDQHNDHDDYTHLRHVHIDLYVGLPCRMARRVSNQHNQKSTSKPATFYDQATQARRLLFEMASLDIDMDEPPSEIPKDYRKTFCVELGVAAEVCEIYF